MISFKNMPDVLPYIEFENMYKKAVIKKQASIEAVSISSWDQESCEVNSRFVNLKHINVEEWTFYSSYNGQKMKEFANHDQISALFYWNSINVQIRIKAKIFKTPSYISDNHFLNRSKEKNALAISSMQSKEISSYEEVIENYRKILESNIDHTKRPKYWGGLTFTPYYFEFWEGDSARLNKRRVFSKAGDSWKKYILQP